MAVRDAATLRSPVMPCRNRGGRHETEDRSEHVVGGDERFDLSGDVRCLRRADSCPSNSSGNGVPAATPQPAAEKAPLATRAHSSRLASAASAPKPRRS
jgi:hypothetical protein